MLKLLSLARPFLSLGWLALIPGGGFAAAGASVFSAAVSFLSSRFGTWIGVALIGAGLYVVGDVHRAALDRARYRAEWAAAVNQAEAARVARDAAIQRDVAADADRRIGEIQRESEQLQAKVADYDKVLSTSNAVACRATADDARRLRQLWTSPGASR
jgi:hypothetical protein